MAKQMTQVERFNVAKWAQDNRERIGELGSHALPDLVKAEVGVTLPWTSLRRLLREHGIDWKRHARKPSTKPKKSGTGRTTHRPFLGRVHDIETRLGEAEKRLDRIAALLLDS